MKHTARAAAVAAILFNLLIRAWEPVRGQSLGDCNTTMLNAPTETSVKVRLTGVAEWPANPLCSWSHSFARPDGTACNWSATITGDGLDEGFVNVAVGFSYDVEDYSEARHKLVVNYFCPHPSDGFATTIRSAPRTPDEGTDANWYEEVVGNIDGFPRLSFEGTVSLNATGQLVVDITFTGGTSPGRPLFTAPIRAGSDFQFTLVGETNRSYIIQTCTNLQDWTPVITNTTPGTVREIRVPMTGGRSFFRAVEAKRLFGFALATRGMIDLNGNSLTTDSFDSSDPNYSTSGLYDPAKRKDGGNLGAYAGLTNSVNVGAAYIMGKVSTGPGAGISIGPNGAVGDAAWHSNPANAGKIQPGWSSDDMNVDFPDVQPPFTGGGFGLSGGSYNGTNYTYLLGSGNYQVSSLSMSGSQKMVVTGHAVLYVTGNVNVSGNAFIQIAPGASLKLYVKGSSASLTGNGIVNDTGNAMNFMYYGLPSNTSLSLTGNGTFTGVIYAPEADFTLNGGGSGGEDFSGATVTKTVKMNGNFNFHFDESLKMSSPVL